MAILLKTAAEIEKMRRSGQILRQADEVVARAVRSVIDLDLTDERSLSAAVRDSVAHAVPVSR